MLIVIFNIHGVVNYEFVPQGQNLNQQDQIDIAWQLLSFPKIQMALKGRMSIDITMIEVNLRDAFVKFKQCTSQTTLNGSVMAGLTV